MMYKALTGIVPYLHTTMAVKNKKFAAFLKYIPQSSNHTHIIDPLGKESLQFCAEIHQYPASGCTPAGIKKARERERRQRACNRVRDKSNLGEF